jgi:uncharacterized protein YjbI with pentapeptide repeats
MHSVRFERVEGIDTSFEGTAIDRVDFHDAALFGACFQGAKLSNVDFRNASLQNANFDNTDWHGAKFIGSTVSNASFNGATGLTLENCQWLIDNGAIGLDTSSCGMMSLRAAS